MMRITLMKVVDKIIIIGVLLILLTLNKIAIAQDNLPHLFLFLGGDKAALYNANLNRPCISGAQIIYSWKQLEPKKNLYDFSKIKNDLRSLDKIDKKLFIQLQDRSFDPNVFNVPDYIREEEIYHGGVAMQYDSPGEGKPVVSGWVARVWDPAVRERFQLLIKKLATEFDGKIYGINLPETAVDFDQQDPPKDFTPDKYFYAELENISVLREAFHKSTVVQYVNFFPGEWNNDHFYMSRFFDYARTHHIGLGGPDVVPYKKAQMANSYPFFHQLKGNLLISMAIQEPDYTYINPQTGKPYTFSDFYRFTQYYLGANILFWNVQEPFYSNQLCPKLTSEHFKCRELN